MKVLIVDDEYLICTHIRCSIPWEELGMQVVGEARDLESAVEAVEQLEPDIVLTDIRMPGIAGGIGLVQYLHRNAPHIYTVIISGHSDFSYAQDAIAAGVFAYLLKPVEPESYCAVLKNIKDHWTKRQAQQTLFQQLQQMQQASALEEQLQRFLLAGTQNPQLLQYLRRHLQGNSCCVLVTESSAPQSDSEEWLIPAVQDRPYCCFHFRTGQICILAMTDAGLKDFTVRCRDLLREQSVYVGISTVGASLEELPNLYQQAADALLGKFSAPNRSVFSAAPDTGATPASAFFEYDLLLSSLRGNDREQASKLVEQTFCRLREIGARKTLAAAITWQLVLAAESFLKENKFRSALTTEVLDENIQRAADLTELHRLTDAILGEALNTVFPEYGSSRIVEDAKKHILSHYHEAGLSLSSVAQNLYVNASYLSSLFKRVTGISLTEFINQTRLGKAKELLDQGYADTIAVLAHWCGYNNEYYFMRCFKKRYGASPNAYLRNKNTGL